MPSGVGVRVPPLALVQIQLKILGKIKAEETLDYSVNEVQAWLREIKLHVSAEEIQQKSNEKIKELRQKMSIPGFRKGKAPVDIIRLRFGKVILEEILEDVIQDSFREIVTKENLEIISSPEVREQNWDEHEGLDVTFEVEIEPDIELKKYTGLYLTKEIHKIADDEIDKAIERLREKNAVIQPVEEGAELGDYVHADLQEVDDRGLPILGHKAEDIEFPLGEGAFDKEFGEQLLGVKKDEERRIVDPEEGKEDKYYAVKVKDVTRHILPEINDDFAKDLGDYESIEDLRQKVLGYLEEENERRIQNNLIDSLISALISENPFEVPPQMIDNLLNVYVDDIKKQAKSDFDVDAFKESEKSTAIRTIKWYLIQKKLAELENLQVTDADVDAYIEKLAEEKNQSLKKLKAKYSLKDRREKLKDHLQEEKIIDFLLKNSEIEEVEIKSTEQKIVTD